MSDKEIQALIGEIVDHAFAEATDSFPTFRKFLGYDYEGLGSNSEASDTFAETYKGFWEIKHDHICIYLKQHGYKDAEKLYKNMRDRTKKLLRKQLEEKKGSFKKKEFLADAKNIALEELSSAKKS